MPIIEVDFSQLPSEEDLARQAEWRDRSVAKIKMARATRLRNLDHERGAIKDATKAYRSIDLAHVPSIVLRNKFVALDSPRPTLSVGEVEPQEPTLAEAERQRGRELATRPPLTRVVHRQSNALQLYLTAVYVAHLERGAGHAFKNERPNTRGASGRDSWSLLAGLSAPKASRARRARMRRALDELSEAGLAKLDAPGKSSRYERWMLLAEDGTRSTYRVPSEVDTLALSLPAAFFFNGWHLVLTPGEITMLLAIRHMHQQRGGSTSTDERRRWIALPQSVRYRTYGISGEMYFHAQQLYEFGLVDLNDPMRTRRRGKISNRKIMAVTSSEQDDGEVKIDKGKPADRVPYQFTPCLDTSFNDDAFTVVRDTLSTLVLPHRLDSQGSLMTPQDLVKAYQNAERLSRQQAP